VAAQLSGEPFWIDAFMQKRDLHTAMAMAGWKINREEDVPKHIRDQAKCCNFGNLFLGSPYTLCAQSAMTLPEATAAWKIWWSTVPVYKRWTEEQIRRYKVDKCVWTYFRRKRDMRRMVEEAEKKSKGKGKGGWGFCDRTSVNSPIQGTAADLMKIGMVRVGKWIKKEGLQNFLQMSLTVHDEIVMLVRDHPEMFEILREAGRQLTQTPKGHKLPTIKGWQIPLVVDIEIGKNWAELKDIDKLDPETKDRVKEGPARDELILIIPSLDKDQSQSLLELFRKASAVKDVVLVPLKIQVGGRIYRQSEYDKVHEPTILEGIRRIPGVTVKTS